MGNHDPNIIYGGKSFSIKTNQKGRRGCKNVPRIETLQSMPTYSFCHYLPSRRRRSVCSSDCPEGDTDSLRLSYQMSVRGNGAQSCHLPNGLDSDLQETLLTPWCLRQGQSTSKGRRKVPNKLWKAVYQQVEMKL